MPYRVLRTLARATRRLPVVLLVCSVIATMVSPASVLAGAGDLDGGFGKDGLVTTRFAAGSTDEALAVSIQTDGRIVVAGRTNANNTLDFALARYNDDGSLDASFGDQGQVITSFSALSSDDALGLVIQPDGRIVAVGRSDRGGTLDFALARYNWEGSLDPSFGQDGLVTTSFGAGSSDEAMAVAIQPDGRIVVVGRSDNGGSLDFALARYNPDGSLDTSFGRGGLVTTTFGATSDDEAFALALQPDGRIVVAGRSDRNGSVNFALARYRTDGILDQTFGRDGLLTTPFSATSQDVATSLAITSSGRIIAAGTSDRSGSRDFALARYKADGTLDLSFGDSGLVTTTFGAASNDAGVSMGIQPNGQTVVVGRTDSGGTADFALARYNGDGSLDNSFGRGGLTLTTFGATSNDEAAAAAIQSNGQIVAVGRTDSGGDFDFALARY